MLGFCAHKLEKCTAVPFITRMCPNSTVTEGFGAYNRGGSDTTTQIGAGLSSIGLLSRKWKYIHERKD
jgi:hypothetical protein